jgi:hypothetical protein
MNQYGKSTKYHKALVNALKNLLNDYHVLPNFIEYVADGYGTSIDEYLNSMSHRSSSFIFDAFSWDQTTEGDTFWYSLHIKWNNYLKQTPSATISVKKYNSIW